jgi:hypothetical protein
MVPQPSGKRDGVIGQFGEVVRTGLACELDVNDPQLQARVVVSDRFQVTRGCHFMLCCPGLARRDHFDRVRSDPGELQRPVGAVRD